MILWKQVEGLGVRDVHLADTHRLPSASCCTALEDCRFRPGQEGQRGVRGECGEANAAERPSPSRGSSELCLPGGAPLF